MTPSAPRLTLLTPPPVASVSRPAPGSSSRAEAADLSLGVVLLLDVLVRIEQRRQARLRTLQTKAAG